MFAALVGIGVNYSTKNFPLGLAAYIAKRPVSFEANYQKGFGRMRNVTQRKGNKLAAVFRHS
jgi:hypothetical protein